MGQSASQPERRAEAARPPRRTSVFRRSLHVPPPTDEGQQDGLLDGQHSTPERRNPRLRSRPGSVHRLSQLLHIDSAPPEDTPPPEGSIERSRGSAVLQRTRSTLRDLMSRRDTTSRSSGRPRQSRIISHRSSYVHSGMNSDGDDYYPPRLPSIDHHSLFDHEPFIPSNDVEQPPPRSSSSLRRPNLRALNSLRPDRPFRHLASLRRRRSPPPSSVRRIGGPEDQASMISRLLSIAAAATAATLMGDDPQALSEARSLTAGAGVGDVGGGGEDGSFDGFLRALQNGRIASALRGAGSETENGSSLDQGPLNFFRMFRFGPTGPESSNTPAAESGDSDAENPEGRMVPIIIVGIRSISPSAGTNAGSSTDDLPPFIDALGSFPSPLPTQTLGTHGHESIDSILRPPQNGTSFRHRRRASLGAFGMGRNRLSDRMDDQRDHRSPERRRDRPWSVASSSSVMEPRPPPVTPASPSPEMSRIPSGSSTPAHSRPASFVANSVRDFGNDSRRNSALHRASMASPLSSHTEETLSLHSTHSSTNLLSSQTHDEPFQRNSHRRSDTMPNVHYPRYASGHPRRNGMVEPENLPSLSRSSTSNRTDSTTTNTNNERRNSHTDSRSWIIYVLGGSYPENHPILTTPSLFTENPTYEDMMLLSALLGPAKAPVATDEDVENAGGLFTIEPAVRDEAVQEGEPTVSDTAKTTALVAAATESDERIGLELGQQCLVCLCDFEPTEIARKLVKCGHLFHKECIDQWLTQGRNSCPLCRGQGVDEKEKPDTPSSEQSEDTVPGASATDGNSDTPRPRSSDALQHHGAVQQAF